MKKEGKNIISFLYKVVKYHTYLQLIRAFALLKEVFIKNFHLINIHLYLSFQEQNFHFLILTKKMGRISYNRERKDYRKSLFSWETSKQ